MPAQDPTALTVPEFASLATAVRRSRRGTRDPRYDAARIEARLLTILDIATTTAAAESNDPLTRLLTERAQLRGEVLGWIGEIRMAAARRERANPDRQHNRTA